MACPSSPTRIPSINELPLTQNGKMFFQAMDEMAEIFMNSDKSVTSMDTHHIVRHTSSKSPEPFNNKNNAENKKVDIGKNGLNEEANKKTKFEQWEDMLIVNERAKLGNKWTIIASKLPGRSPVAIKNRWYSVLRSKFPTEAMLGKNFKQDPLIPSYMRPEG